MDENEEELRFAERFRQSHHAIATYYAMGWTDSKIAQVTGRSRRGLTILRNTPMFDELVAQKRKIVEEQGAKVTEDLLKAEFEWRTLAMKNVIQGEIFIAEKYEEADLTGNLPPFRDINTISSDRLDRLGYSKHTVTHHTADFGALLDRAITRSNRKGAVADLKIVDAEVLSLPNFSDESSGQAMQPTQPTVSVARVQEQRKVVRDPPSAPGPSFVEALRRKLA